LMHFLEFSNHFLLVILFFLQETAVLLNHFCNFRLKKQKSTRQLQLYFELEIAARLNKNLTRLDNCFFLGPKKRRPWT